MTGRGLTLLMLLVMVFGCDGTEQADVHKTNLRERYSEAVARTTECVEALGLDVGPIEEQGILLRPSVTGPSRADEFEEWQACAAEHLNDVEREFVRQEGPSAAQQLLTFDSVVKCLRDLGHELDNVTDLKELDRILASVPLQDVNTCFEAVTRS